ncbi:MAG: helix-turn-helix transcriptional regulator [Mycobacterium sp.]
MEPDLIPASEMKSLIPGTSDQYWATLRHKGGGPEYVKVGPPGRARKVYYRRADIEAWLKGSRFTRTDRPVTA